MSAWKHRLKSRVRKLRAEWWRRTQPFRGVDLRAALAGLGVRPGQVLLAHSAWAAFQGFVEGPMEAISALQAAVGPEGSLLMPTQPMEGSALTWVESGARFDVRRTASRMGLLTELFRRSEGTGRSEHPTHPVAGWGRKAPALLRDHWLAETPCGRGTPYGRLLEEEAWIAFLGTGLAPFTFGHTVDELLEDLLPYPVFTQERYEVEFIGWEGLCKKTAPMRLFDPVCASRRDIPALAPHFRQAGILREARVGRLTIQLLRPAAVVETLRTLAPRGIYFYKM